MSLKNGRKKIFRKEWQITLHTVRVLVCTIAMSFGDLSFFSRKFSPYPSAGIQRGGKVGLSSVPHGKLVAYKSYI